MRLSGGLSGGLNRLGGAGGAAGDPDLLAGLFAFWRFDGNGTDSSGNGRHLTMFGDVYSPGKVGQSLLSGSAGRDVSLTAWSLSVWLLTDTPQEGSGGAIISGGISLVRVTGDGSSSSLIAADETVGPHVIADETWHHVVVTSAGSVYVNGLLIGTGTSPPLADTLAVDPFGGDFPNPFDLLGIWSRALSAAEVTALYNGGSGFDPT